MPRAPIGSGAARLHREEFLDGGELELDLLSDVLRQPAHRVLVALEDRGRLGEPRPGGIEVEFVSVLQEVELFDRKRDGPLGFGNGFEQVVVLDVALGDARLMCTLGNAYGFGA
jgi:hypothetical protein